MSNRRDFLKKAAAGAAGLAVGSNAMSMSAKSYKSIIGANDRLNVALVGLGRRVGGFYSAIGDSNNNIRLEYLCDVKESQRTRAAKKVKDHIDYDPKLENDIRKVLDDKKVDIVFNATPDHWHTPGAIMALKAGKHVYLEKPSSHNMFENELMVAAQKKYDRLVQMGNQQRSSVHSRSIIKEIHSGIIGKAYKAVAFYTNSRGEVPVQKKAAVPKGLDWELFQGPAPRREYTEETWDYNWHWYGWDYGTAELGNNATHELDIARWALQVDLPEAVGIQAGKYQFENDGWEMYDTMEAFYNFPGGKLIKWDGRSRNSYDLYGEGRGTIVYGSEGSVFIDRGNYKVYDRSGKLVKESGQVSTESGTALGGGGDLSTAHIVNFFNAIRKGEKLNAPIDDANISMAMVHYGNVAYRIGEGFEIDEQGRMMNRRAMQLWGRSYEPGWEPSL